MVNLFGKGFIGSRYAEQYSCTVNDRNDLTPKESDILYMISTVDNYHVKTNPYIDIDTNLTTLIKVLENWRHTYSGGVFNFVSSWFVYGDTDLPAREDSYCNPKGFYSITKRAAEQLLVSYCETHGLKYRILRFANVLGPGDTKAGPKKNAVTYMVNQMKQGLPVNLYDGGEFIRDYIHVDDLCAAVNLVLTSGKVNEIYNIGNGQGTKFKDIIDHVVQLGSTSQINNIEQAEFHKIVQVKSMFMDTTKLKDLGYNPKYSIFNIIEELYTNKYTVS
jgi:nucleoside-diphosphate-sugar epimerase